jgi:Leucine-rich repeat (LRR) protein
MPLVTLTRELVAEIARQYPTLQSLNLSKNTLREVRYLDALPWLQQLDLSGNRLRAFPPQLGASCPRLAYVDLGGNAM